MKKELVPHPRISVDGREFDLLFVWLDGDQLMGQGLYVGEIELLTEVRLYDDMFAGCPARSWEGTDYPYVVALRKALAQTI